MAANRIDNLIKLIDYSNQAKGADKVPKRKLVTNGVTTEMPLLGLGTWKQKPDSIVTQAVEYALRVGYRHIDCAYVYGNEKGVGLAFKNVFNDGKILRKDVFITTKLWNNAHEPELVPKQLKESLNNLGLDYIDLYLIHWPHAFKSGGDMFPKDNNGNMLYNTKTTLEETWKGMEECVKLGLAKHIGVSNFTYSQLNRILKCATIKPTVQQIERHPWLQEPKMKKLCDDNNVLLTAYSPLGSGDRPFDNLFYPVLMKDQKLINLANKIGVPVSKILIRWAIESGTAVIPKSKNPLRIKSNIEVFDFELTQEHMNILNNMDRNFRLAFPVFKHPKTGLLYHRDAIHPEYPLKDTPLYQTQQEIDKIWGNQRDIDNKEDTKEDDNNDNIPGLVVRYFPMGGRAHSIRQALYIGGISFKDEFLNGELWGKYKAADKQKWSGIPEMDVIINGKRNVMAQSNSLTRYAGKLARLYPSDKFLALQVDEIMDAVEDFVNILVPSFREQDEKKRLEMRKKLVSDETSAGMPYWLKRLNKRIIENENNGNKNGYLVGNSLTIADLKVVSLSDGIPKGRLDGVDKDLIDKIAPKLAKLINIVNNDPKIVQFQKKFDANCAVFNKDNTKNVFSY